MDEAFLDVTHCQSLLGTPLEIGRLVKEAVSKASGLTCSVGVSGDKTTAKYAAKHKKPDGLVVIPPWESERTLAPIDITELSGINTGVARFLLPYGVVKCGDMKKIPISVLAKRFGNVGRRIWLMAQGKDPDVVTTNVAPPKTMGHGKVLPPRTVDVEVILTYFQHMSEKVAQRLRHNNYKASHFMMGLKTELGWIQTKVKLANAIDDGKQLFHWCQLFVLENLKGEAVWQVQITALNPTKEEQADLFEDHTQSLKQKALNETIDKINQKFGAFTVAPSRLMGKSSMPNVIAPSWKPTGHRKTV